MKLLLPCIILLSLVWFSDVSEKSNQEYPCFVESNAFWQLYGYRNNEEGTEDLRANFQYWGHGSMNLIIRFKEGKERNIYQIKGHSLVSGFTGRMELSGDSLLFEKFTKPHRSAEPYWGLYYLEETFKNCSSYSCSNDSLYVNFYDENYTAIFFKVDQFQYPPYLRSDTLGRDNPERYKPIRY